MTDSSIPPFRDLPAGHLEARKQHLLRELAREPIGLRLSRPITPGFERPRSWRPLGVVAVAVIALAGTGVAIAAGLGAFQGTPAPPDVSTNFKQLNQFADAAVQKGFASTFPQTDASKAHGVIEIQTPDGPEDLWAAPNNQGGQCYLIDWANDPIGKDGSRYGMNGCEQSPPPASNISVGDVWVAPHPDVMTVYGSVYVPAATVEITLDDLQTKMAGDKELQDLSEELGGTV